MSLVIICDLRQTGKIPVCLSSGVFLRLYLILSVIQDDISVEQLW